MPIGGPGNGPLGGMPSANPAEKPAKAEDELLDEDALDEILAEAGVEETENNPEKEKSVKEKLEEVLGFSSELSHEKKLKILRLAEEYPEVFDRFKSLKDEEGLVDDGVFSGGIGPREGGSFEMKIDRKLFDEAWSRKFEEVFEHEFGHAVYQHFKDVNRFFNYHGLVLPESLRNMKEFVSGISSGGFKDLLKKPKDFIRSFVSFYGEAPSEKGDRLEEKMAELFFYSRKNKENERELFKSFSNFFGGDKFEDWSSYIEDPALVEKYNRFFKSN